MPVRDGGVERLERGTEARWGNARRGLERAGRLRPPLPQDSRVIVGERQAEDAGRVVRPAERGVSERPVAGQPARSHAVDRVGALARQLLHAAAARVLLDLAAVEPLAVGRPHALGRVELGVGDARVRKPALHRHHRAGLLVGPGGTADVAMVVGDAGEQCLDRGSGPVRRRLLRLRGLRLSLSLRLRRFRPGRLGLRLDGWDLGRLGLGTRIGGVGRSGHGSDRTDFQIATARGQQAARDAARGNGRGGQHDQEPGARRSAALARRAHTERGRAEAHLLAAAQHDRLPDPDTVHEGLVRRAEILATVTVPSGRPVRARWRRETSSSGRTRSQPSSRPMTTRAGGEIDCLAGALIRSDLDPHRPELRLVAVTIARVDAAVKRRCRRSRIGDNAAVSQTRTVPAEVERERPGEGRDVERDVPWIVIVWNDPVNLMSYVTLVLQKLFGYSRAKATRADAPGAQRRQGGRLERHPREGRARRRAPARARAVGDDAQGHVSARRQLERRGRRASGCGSRPRARAAGRPGRGARRAASESDADAPDARAAVPAGARGRPAGRAGLPPARRSRAARRHGAKRCGVLATRRERRADGGRARRLARARSTTCGSCSAPGSTWGEDALADGLDPDDPDAPMLALYGYLSWLQEQAVEAAAAGLGDGAA